jgi:dipeptide transport system ATP-binding protein
MPHPTFVMEVENLARHYEISTGWFKPKATVKALNGVSFKLAAGKTLAVVGESGCGKSTLARQLTLIESPSSGSIVLDGVAVNTATAAEIKAMRSKVQMVFQNPYGSLNPRQKIGDQLAEPLLMNTPLTAPERKARVLEMMKIVGLRAEHYHRYPHMFSGGQRQRIAIARAMMLHPKIVIADEPTSALDVSIQAQVLNLFMDLQQELKTAYVFISHNLSVVEHVADEVMVMYLGQVVEMASKTDLFANPKHPYTKVLLSATPSLFEEDRKINIAIKGELPSPLNPPSGCAFHKRCPYAVARCQTEMPVLRELDRHQVACFEAK